MKEKIRMVNTGLFACATLLAFSAAIAQQTPTTAPVTAADNTGINQRDRSEATTKPTDQPNNQADIKVAAEVRRAIVKDKSLSTMAHNVKLVAVNGVVTLRGPVDSQSEKEKVGKCAASVAGVSSVDNLLDVKNHLQGDSK